jgi:hypothetical protein
VIEGELLDFIRSSIRSVLTLEILLLMRRQSRRAWAADELVRETRSSDFVVSEGLSTLQTAGLVTADGENVYRYAPASPQFRDESDLLLAERKAADLRRRLQAEEGLTMTSVLPALIYLLCLATSAACAYLLVRSYQRNRTRLLLFSAASFVLLAINNLFVVFDLLVLPQVDFVPLRQLAALAAIGVLLFGFIWDTE